MPSPLKRALESLRRLRGDRFDELYREVRRELDVELADVLETLTAKRAPVVSQALNDIAYYSVRLLVTTDVVKRAAMTRTLGHVRGILESEAAIIQLDGMRRIRRVVNMVVERGLEVVLSSLV